VKKTILSLLTLLILFAFTTPTPVQAEEFVVDQNTIYYIGSPYCTSCKEAEEFFKTHPGFSDSFYKLNTLDPANKEKIEEVMKTAGVDEIVTPLFIRGGESLTGWNPVVKSDLADWVGYELAPEDSNPFENIDTDSIGGLILITFLLGNVDGVNPCSIWALMFLMTMMINRNYNKKQIFVIGGVYILTIAAFYSLYIVGVSFFTGNILENFLLRFVIFLITGFIGVSNMLTAFNIKIPFKFSIQDDDKKRFLKYAGKTLKTRKDKSGLINLSITAVSLGTFASLIELPCTAGFPIIWNGYLKDAGINGVPYLLFLSGYIFLYILIECVILFGVVFSMKKIQMNPKVAMALKVGTGLLMVGLGFSLLMGDALVRNSMALVLLTVVSALVSFLYYFFKK
jgi:hypothetical protein